MLRAISVYAPRGNFRRLTFLIVGAILTILSCSPTSFQVAEQLDHDSKLGEISGYVNRQFSGFAMSRKVTRKDIGRAVKQAREKSGLTQVQAAKHLQISVDTLSDKENGIAPVQVEEFIQMRDLYGEITGIEVGETSGSGLDYFRGARDVTAALTRAIAEIQGGLRAPGEPRAESEAAHVANVHREVARVARKQAEEQGTQQRKEGGGRGK